MSNKKPPIRYVARDPIPQKAAIETIVSVLSSILIYLDRSYRHGYIYVLIISFTLHFILANIFIFKIKNQIKIV